MGTEPEAGTDGTLSQLQESLGSDAVTFVDAFNEDIASVIEGASELEFDYLVGDVADRMVSSNGHVHFDLVHGGSSVHCVLFGYRRRDVAADLEDGTQVAVMGDLSYYEQEGSVSIVVEDVVTVGTGVYQRIYEQNREVLAEEGLLDPAGKRSLPELPARVGLVTSADSDAREDAVTSIHSRYPGVDIVIQDTTVQGEEAMASLMAGITTLDDDPDIEVIVLTRGGGSDKHLRVFNETPLCRVIHRTETPVVVGVGHETDRTLADEVADRRVMTPTHVGEIVPERADHEEQRRTLEDRLDTAYTSAVTTRLDDLETRLDGAYEEHVTAELTSLRTDLDHAFESLARDRLNSLSTRLDAARSQYDLQQQHRAETTRYRRRQRRLQVALLVLGLLVVLLAAFIILTP